MTLIIPAHNEERRLPATLRRYGSALAQRYGAATEIVVIANACTDRTVAVATAAGRDLPAVRVVEIAAAIGKGGAVLEGFRHATGKAVLFADADGATDPASLIRLVDALDRADVAIGSRYLRGSRIARRQPLRRRILSTAFNGIVRAGFKLELSDTQCGAKALRADAVRRLAQIVREQSWAFDVDLLLSARKLGLRIVERPVAWTDMDGSQLSVRSSAGGVIAALIRLRRRGLHTVRNVTPPAPTVARATRTSRRVLAINWRCLRHPEAGGAELNLFEQVRRWRDGGHMVTVIAARDAGAVRLPESETVDGIRILRMGGRFTIYPLVALYLLRSGRRYDRILDVANGIPFFTPLFTRTPGVLLVHHVHGRQWFTEFRAPMAAVGWLLERFVVPLVYRRRQVIAVSPTTRDALVATGFRASKVKIVYNGVTSPSAASGGADPGRSHDAPAVAYVGRIKRYKRLDLLVDAFADLQVAHPRARLDIAGDGDERPKLEQLVKRRGLSGAVTIHGFVDEQRKAELLRRATVFAQPSMHEGWGLSVIEANVHGVPAVAFDVPGLRSAIVDGETGLLARDRDAFRDALGSVLGDSGLRDRMSAAAIEWSRRFSWDKAAAETFAILDATGRSIAVAPTAAALPAP